MSTARSAEVVSCRVAKKLSLGRMKREHEAHLDKHFFKLNAINTAPLDVQDKAFQHYVTNSMLSGGRISVTLRNWITVHIGKPNESYARAQTHKYAEELRAGMTPAQLKGRK